MDFEHVFRSLVVALRQAMGQLLLMSPTETWHSVKPLGACSFDYVKPVSRAHSGHQDDMHKPLALMAIYIVNVKCSRALRYVV